MTPFLSFTVIGEPVAKGRPRFGRGRVYTPKKTKTAQSVVGLTAKAAMRGTKPTKSDVILFLYAYYGINNKVDLDNVLKLHLDSMNGIVYDDDSQVVEIHAWKVRKGPARVDVSVSLEP